MTTSSPARTFSMFIALLAAVVILSTISARLWGGKPETLPEPKQLIIAEEMTLSEFGQANGLPNPALKEIFGLQQKADLHKKVTAYGNAAQIQHAIVLLDAGNRIVVHPGRVLKVFDHAPVHIQAQDESVARHFHVVVQDQTQT